MDQGIRKAGSVVKVGRFQYINKEGRAKCSAWGPTFEGTAEIEILRGWTNGSFRNPKPYYKGRGLNDEIRKFLAINGERADQEIFFHDKDIKSV